MTSIYLASSWRNRFQPRVVEILRDEGYEVYDFKNPPTRSGFAWEQTCKDWASWDLKGFLRSLEHPIAEAGFNSDFNAMQKADLFVLLLPSGRSAHLEVGWAIGQGKPACILIPEYDGPDLTYKLASTIVGSVREVVQWADQWRTPSERRADVDDTTVHLRNKASRSPARLGWGWSLCDHERHSFSVVHLNEMVNVSEYVRAVVNGFTLNFGQGVTGLCKKCEIAALMSEVIQLHEPAKKVGE